MRLRLSLYTRLMLVALVPLLLAMGSAWAIASVVFSRALEDRVLGEVRHATEVLIGSGLPLTAELLHRVAALQGTEFVLVDGHGDIALTTYREPPAGLVAAIAELRGRGARPNEALRVSLGNAPHVAVGAQLPPRDPRYAALLAFAPLTEAREAARRAALGLAGAVLVAGALIALLAHALVRSVSAPLVRLRHFADAIAAGARDARLDVDEPDEIGALATALEEMARRIRTFEEQLAAKSRLSALGELAARIAHEVRNPLTGLKMHLQLLAERLPSSDGERVQMLLREVQRLELIVDSSLTLARERRANPEPTDVGALIGEVARLMEPSLAHRRIALELRLTALPLLSLDPGLLRQAVLNLVVNAADALADGGRIRLETAIDRDSGRLRIMVEDDGPGLPDSPALSTKPFGLGLGLSVCREFAEAHGGILMLTAHGGLGGARATIELPAPVAAAVSA